MIYTEKQCYSIVSNAIKTGRIIRPNVCSRCGKRQPTKELRENPWTGEKSFRKLSVRIVAHHNDYSKPLEVEWVCRKCHSLIHKKEYKQYA